MFGNDVDVAVTVNTLASAATATAAAANVINELSGPPRVFILLFPSSPSTSLRTSRTLCCVSSCAHRVDFVAVCVEFLLPVLSFCRV